ncbi:hypothetical protein KIL84_002653 [Mauremys mutica]|uniref:Uncharacterized protein n=1 Tax=Mauremys mutica TaxID=74926 RepID=A0A9D3WUR5_9SAUR|nr:hypothetical protein KIL84_002653 [Mauremys mutica]
MSGSSSLKWIFKLWSTPLTLHPSLVSSIILRQNSWLQSSSFPKEVQTTLDGLLFDNHKLFSDKMDESLYSQIIFESHHVLFAHNWGKITTDQWVLDVIHRGT